MKRTACIAGVGWGIASWGVVTCVFWSPWGLALVAVGGLIGLQAAKKKKVKVGP